MALIVLYFEQDNRSVGKEKNIRFKIILEEGDESGYTVYVPCLPGCISEGETAEEALKNIQEAIELYNEQADS